MEIGEKYLIGGDVYIIMESSYRSKLACLVDVTNCRVFGANSLSKIEETVNKLGGTKLNDGHVKKFN